MTAGLDYKIVLGWGFLAGCFGLVGVFGAADSIQYLAHAKYILSMELHSQPLFLFLR
jgi:hypothetical protein